MQGAESKKPGAIWLGIIAAVIAIGFVSSPAAQAKSPHTLSGVQVAGGGAQWKLLVSMNLPLNVSGSKVRGKVSVSLPGHSWWGRWEALVHSSSLRLADRRRTFAYVAGVGIPAKLGRALARNGSRANAETSISYSQPTVSRTARRDAGTAVTQKGVRRAPAGRCETLPRLLLESPAARSRTVGYPVCGQPLNWRLVRLPGQGRVSTAARRVTFTRESGQRGADEFELAGYRKGRLLASQRIHVRVGSRAASEVSVVAFGDSVTAGFGYFGATGKPMRIGQLLDCKPGATTLNDACSSNSPTRNSSVGSKPTYLPDFGLSRNISWPAQWANQYGITDYENYAVTGSAPADWLPGGQFHPTLQKIESQDPDYILMTLGANPLLSDVLFNVDVMGCALESDLFGDFRQCVLDAFATVNLSSNMNQIFTELVQETGSNIVLMQYPLTIPSSALAYSATQLEQMEALLNEVIASEAAQVSTTRITVVTPPRFNVGIDMEPMYPSKYSCSFLGYTVDGPSVQSTPTQDEFELDHPLSFCSGPSFGSPWVISGDTGIHPSATGYAQMAGQIPAPGS